MFGFFWVVILLLIVIVNFFDVYECGVILLWKFLLMGIGMLLFGIVIVEVSWRWFNFMFGSDVCIWCK